jgi:hypothetical protein
MPIPSKQIELTKFQWKLESVPSDAGVIPAPFSLRSAAEQELEEAVSVIQASYNLDHQWSGCARYIDNIVLPAVGQIFKADCTCLFVQHGNRVIAASAYSVDPINGVNLVSGPCVYMEYRNRSIGGALLGATLLALRELGVKEAIGQALPSSPAAKYLCSKFSGQPIAGSTVEIDSSAAVS